MFFVSVKFCFVQRRIHSAIIFLKPHLFLSNNKTKNNEKLTYSKTKSENKLLSFNCTR